MALNRRYLRIPRDATFPTLNLPETFEEYAFAYYLAATHLWDGIPKHLGVPRPDSLVHPILFLIHHYLELEMKQVIVLSYSIGSVTGELAPKMLNHSHDLSSLLSLMDSNLAELGTVPKESLLSRETRDMIDDMNKFGMLGQALRYPYHTVNSKVVTKMFGSDLPDSLIPDIPAVMKLVEEASREFNCLIGYLLEYDQALFDSRH